MRIGRRPASDPSVVLFLQSGSVVRADAEIHLTLARLLPQLGFTVLAATPANEGASELEVTRRMRLAGAIVHSTAFGPTSLHGGGSSLFRLAVVEPWRALVSTVMLIRFARQHRVGVVHCVEKVRESVLAYVLARATGARLVIHLHLKVAPWFSRPTLWVMRRADGLLAISQFVARSAVEMGMPPDRIGVVLNGMVREPADLSRSSARAALISELRLSADALLVGIAARMTPWKGHEALVRGLGRLVGDHPEVVLLVMGDEAVADSAGGHPLLELADRSGLGRRRVRLLGYRTDVAAILAGLDVFAMPSYEEPFGLVFIEAMAAGTAVVGVANGGTPEVVLDGVTGLLADPDDLEDDVVRQLGRLLADPVCRAALGAAGAERVRTSFGGERMARETADFYRTLPRAAGDGADHAVGRPRSVSAR